MLAALAGVFALAVGPDTGCRWENDVLCGGTRNSPLQPLNGDTPGNGAHSQQQQEKLTPYELEKQNENGNEVQPTIFRGGAKHTLDDGHGHSSHKKKKSTHQKLASKTKSPEPSPEPSRNTKKLKSSYTGCRWANDVHCGGTEAVSPGAGAAAAAPTSEKTQQQQELPTPYELEMQNEKDSAIKPQIFDVGGSPPVHSLDNGHGHKPPSSKKKSKVQSTDEHNLWDGHNHTAKSAAARKLSHTKRAAAAAERKHTKHLRKKRANAAKERKNLKSSYNGCRWANDVHCGGTETAPPGAGVGAPTSENQTQQQEIPTPYELEMENEKDNGVTPQIFDGAQVFAKTSKHNLVDGHDHGDHGDPSKRSHDDLNDGENHNLVDGHAHADLEDLAATTVSHHHRGHGDPSKSSNEHNLNDGHNHVAPGQPYHRERGRSASSQ